jgi:hypothetical protein
LAFLALGWIALGWIGVGLLAILLLRLVRRKHCVAVTDRRILVIALSLTGRPRWLAFSAPRAEAAATSVKREPLVPSLLSMRRSRALLVTIGGVRLALDPRVWRTGEIGIITQALAPAGQAADAVSRAEPAGWAAEGDGVSGDTRSGGLAWLVDVSAAARGRARVLRGTAAAQWTVVTGMMMVWGSVSSYAPRTPWLRFPALALWAASTWLVVRFAGRMRQGDSRAAQLAAGATASVVLVVLALLLGADHPAPMVFVKGMFTPLGDYLSNLAYLPPGLFVLVVAPLAFALNASRFGHWLRGRRLLGASIPRWVILVIAASELLLLFSSLTQQLLDMGVPSWSLGAVLTTTLLTLLVVIGLVEIRRSRRALAVPLPPAWEPAAQARGRRLFTGRQPVRVLVLLALSAFLAIWGWLFLRSPVPNDLAVDEIQQFVGITVLVGMVLLFAAVAMYLRARRWAALRTAEVRARDGRAPVLFLRSFGDDDLRVWAHASPRLALVERLLGRRTERFEVVLGWHLWRFGPVVAVGRPLEKLPPLGAAREYLDQEQWQKEVEKRIDQARAVVVVLGRTSGLLWELQAIERLGATDRMLIVVPPVDDSEAERRWGVLERMVRAEQVGWQALPPVARSRMLVGILDGGQRWSVMTGRPSDEYHYEIALEASVGLLAGRAPTPQGMPDDDTRSQ